MRKLLAGAVLAAILTISLPSVSNAQSVVVYPSNGYSYPSTVISPAYSYPSYPAYGGYGGYSGISIGVGGYPGYGYRPYYGGGAYRSGFGGYGVGYGGGYRAGWGGGYRNGFRR
ncbi:hypothetical protein [Zavarzinella formosa]|uniref:hypothetical protein n=1 Tax=Zavarzinella formosa TaxID=360055 RepID=UPI0002F961B6|nr:hypothetical protein [Zavarzinella formosa]